MEILNEIITKIGEITWANLKQDLFSKHMFLANRGYVFPKESNHFILVSRKIRKLENKRFVFAKVFSHHERLLAPFLLPRQ